MQSVLYFEINNPLRQHQTLTHLTEVNVYDRHQPKKKQKKDKKKQQNKQTNKQTNKTKQYKQTQTVGIKFDVHDAILE